MRLWWTWLCRDSCFRSRATTRDKSDACELLRRESAGEPVELTPVDVLAAAGGQDPLALEALAEVGRVLGMIMSACTAILNPSRYVVGGGLGLAGFDFIAPAAREELMRRTIPESRALLDIVPSRVELPAIGSACLVWYSLSGKVSQS